MTKWARGLTPEPDDSKYEVAPGCLDAPWVNMEHEGAEGHGHTEESPKMLFCSVRLVERGPLLAQWFSALGRDPPGGHQRPLEYLHYDSLTLTK